jgi:hypothetical protein
MAKSESTAVNELIASVQSRAVTPHASPGDDLFTGLQPTRVGSDDRPARFSGTILPNANAVAMPALPRKRAPAGTSRNTLPARVRVATAPAARATTIPPRAAGTPRPELKQPSGAADGWFESTRSDYQVDRAPIDETMARSTLPVERRHPRGHYTRKLVAWGSVVAVVCVLVGGYFAFDGTGKHAHAASAKAKAAVVPAIAAAQADLAAQVAPAQESANAATASAGGAQPQPPTPEQIAAQAPAAVAAAAAQAPEAAAPAPAPAAPVDPAKLVDVRVDSKPVGATVMLVDNGKTSFLGTTPVAATVDSSRAYDLIFTLEGRPTQMIHVDPKRTTHVDLAFDKGATTPAVAAAAAPAAASPAAPAASAAPAARHHHAATRTAAADTASVAAPGGGGGDGTLMVSSKPPCEIWIDGTPTGLITPQRSIALSAGSHKVTLVNSTSNIRKTFPVAINSAQPTKLIQDLMQ